MSNEYKSCERFFIVINGRILDFNDYRKECSKMKKLMISELEPVLNFYGFKAECIDSRENYDKMEMKMYNENLDLELRIELRKKKEEIIEE
ncbi:MAG: hypothetical protein NTV63_04350 [Candidatus Woesearchaeota archaeon]|nr:hypothetical protein [Candidatus Woesearchaeota archaeon]